MNGNDVYAIIYLTDLTTVKFTDEQEAEFKKFVEAARAGANAITTFKRAHRNGRMIWQPQHTEFMDKR